MGGYGQFCPIAKAMELFDQRWTMLVMREVVTGSSRFNEIRRGVPKISPALLSTRLRQLQRAGLIERLDGHGHIDYEPTAAGRELGEVLETIGRWGTRWIGEIGDEDLDPHLLLWDMRRRVELEELPARRVVVEFVFTDLTGPGARWWAVLDRADRVRPVDVCDDDPGFGVDLLLTTTLRTLTHIWRGDRDWSAAVRAGDLLVTGPRSLVQALPRWFTLSMFAGVPRPA
ncbi:winged helix-turn-helix transcriptional regulator [Segeticoccus rhizosphaerae]|jgi:DNA-binding HxlR family transcriptional regulator|uniref:winged helix-turn-helix transcriptional regulator n=1 Tax=Segeticoccus rhizosphaerae TaxID=1104777 RepID=UPI0010BFAACF|nr:MULTISPECIES: helix-turn-helix domain-containing protein [Intrasporangiaceae]